MVVVVSGSPYEVMQGTFYEFGLVRNRAECLRRILDVGKEHFARQKQEQAVPFVNSVVLWKSFYFRNLFKL